MSQINVAKTASIPTPSAGKASLYVDTTGTPTLRFVDDSGFNRAVCKLSNSSTTSQNVASTTRTYLAGSNITVPVNKLQVGSRLRWTISVTKTGAGTATSVFDICLGTNGTTADTARVSFTKPVGTAVIDEARITIDAVVRSIGAAGVMVGNFELTHNLAATGHATIPCVVVTTVSAGFDMTVANLIVGVCVTAGLNDNLTFQMVSAEAWIV